MNARYTRTLPQPIRARPLMSRASRFFNIQDPLVLTFVRHASGGFGGAECDTRCGRILTILLRNRGRLRAASETPPNYMLHKPIQVDGWRRAWEWRQVLIPHRTCLKLQVSSGEIPTARAQRFAARAGGAGCRQRAEWSREDAPPRKAAHPTLERTRRPNQRLCAPYFGRAGRLRRARGPANGWVPPSIR